VSIRESKRTVTGRILENASRAGMRDRKGEAFLRMLLERGMAGVGADTKSNGRGRQAFSGKRPPRDGGYGLISVGRKDGWREASLRGHLESVSSYRGKG
jgi:hypothetical protein